LNCFFSNSNYPSDGKSGTDPVRIIPAKQAFNHCNELMVWLEEHKLCKPDDLISMQRIKELASQHLLANESIASAPYIEQVSAGAILRLDEDETTPHRLYESNSEMERSLTTFLDEENTGNVMRLEGSSIEKRKPTSSAAK